LPTFADKGFVYIDMRQKYSLAALKRKEVFPCETLASLFTFSSWRCLTVGLLQIATPLPAASGGSVICECRFPVILEGGRGVWTLILDSGLMSNEFLNEVRTQCHIMSCHVQGCETWSLTLREEHRLRVFENRVLRRIFGTKRDEVTGDWRKLHNEELHNLFSFPSIIRMVKSRRMRWPRDVARMAKRSKMHVGDLWLSQKERDHKENQEVVGWMMLKWMLARYDGMYGLD
jgi:hypothetical protein